MPIRLDKAAAVALVGAGYYFYTKSGQAPPPSSQQTQQPQPPILEVPQVVQPQSVSVTNMQYANEVTSFMPRPKLMVYCIQGQSSSDTVFDVPVTDNSNRRVMHYDEFKVWLQAVAVQYANSPGDAPQVQIGRPDGSTVVVSALAYR